MKSKVTNRDKLEGLRKAFTSPNDYKIIEEALEIEANYNYVRKILLESKGLKSSLLKTTEEQEQEEAYKEKEKSKRSTDYYLDKLKKIQERHLKALDRPKETLALPLSPRARKREYIENLRVTSPELTGAEIARQIGVSRERVRQVLEDSDLPKTSSLYKTKVKYCSICGKPSSLIKGCRTCFISKNLEVLNKSLKSLSKETLEWLSGFWEGDGSVGPEGSLSFYQKDIRILEYIRSLLTIGTILRQKDQEMHILYLGKKESKLLFETVFLECVSAPRANQLSKVFRCKVSLKTPTLHWFYGFFDAEGCFSITGKKGNIGSPVMSVSQKDRESLEKLLPLVGGKITKNSRFPVLNLRVKETLRILPDYLANSHNEQKKERIVRLLKEHTRPTLF